MAAPALAILNTVLSSRKFQRFVAPSGFHWQHIIPYVQGISLHLEVKNKRKNILPKLATAEHIGAWGLTEANTGSDAGNMRTTAVKDGDNWIINGTKNWITHGKSGDIAVVVCRTGEPRAKNNSTAFIVERGTKGFSGGKKENKLGMRASETAEMIFDNCVIPDENRMGEVGSWIQTINEGVGWRKDLYCCIRTWNCKGSL